MNTAKIAVFFEFNYRLHKIQVIVQVELFKTKQTNKGFLVFYSVVHAMSRVALPLSELNPDSKIIVQV